MKKRKVKRSWWQRPKTIRRLAMGTLSSLILVGGILYFLVAAGGGGGPEKVVLRPFRPAPAFSLPTTSGTDFVSADHVGKHNQLLYFNEGMG